MRIKIYLYSNKYMEVNGEYSTNINEDIEETYEDYQGIIEASSSVKNSSLQRSKKDKKKERTQKQMESLKKAQEARKRNIQLRKEGKLAPKITKKALAKSQEIVMEDMHPDVQVALEEYEEKQNIKYTNKLNKQKKKPLRRKIIIQNESSSESDDEEVIVIQNKKRRKKKVSHPVPQYEVSESSDDDDECYAQPEVISKNAYEPVVRFI